MSTKHAETLCLHITKNILQLIALIVTGPPSTTQQIEVLNPIFSESKAKKRLPEITENYFTKLNEMGCLITQNNATQKN